MRGVNVHSSPAIGASESRFLVGRCPAVLDSGLLTVVSRFACAAVFSVTGIRFAIRLSGRETDNTGFPGKPS
jgi:hypothetical protein